MTGIATNVCVETTARQAFLRDYYVVFTSDCTATYSQRAHDGTLENIDHFFGQVVAFGRNHGVLAAGSRQVACSDIEHGPGPFVIAGLEPANHPLPFPRVVIPDGERGEPIRDPCIPALVVGLEACGAARSWARELTALGHEVVLLPPQYVKPYVKRNKNDSADAEAICEAMSRPTMRFVPVKSAEQQAVLMLVGMRAQLVRRRTQLSNTIRGYAAEFGLVAAKGLCKIEPLLNRAATDKALPRLAKNLFAELRKGIRPARVQLRKIEARLMAWHRYNEQSRRLAEIPGIGPIGATLLVMKVADPQDFQSGRDFAAWMGLTPKDHSTAGKTPAWCDHARWR